MIPILEFKCGCKLYPNGIIEECSTNECVGKLDKK